VSPQKTVNPDGIKPQDLLPGDICNKGVTGPTCNFGERCANRILSVAAR
jgi:phospholipase C